MGSLGSCRFFLGFGLGFSRGGLWAVCGGGKWLVVAAFLPEGDHHDGEFARDGGDGFFLGGFASAGGEFEAMLADGAVGTVTT